MVKGVVLTEKRRTPPQSNPPGGCGRFLLWGICYLEEVSIIKARDSVNLSDFAKPEDLLATHFS
jgi:hypothetical protein